jgi:hypothetical protein
MKKVTLFSLVFTLLCLTIKAQDSLQQYVAKYKFPSGSVVAEVDITLDNGTLQISSAMGGSVLDKIGKDTFALTTFNGTVIFSRNDVKKVTGIKIEVMGTILEGSREEKDYRGSNLNLLPTPKAIFPMRYLSPMPVLLQGDEDAATPTQGFF